MYLKKNLQGYFETLSFPQSSFSCSPANPCCETEEGAKASREEWEPSLHWWAVRAWGFRAAPASSGQAPVMPRCGLLFLPSIGPGSHCMVCEFNRLNWLKTSSFLSLLQQCLANLAPRFSSLHSEASTAGKALPQEQQISLHYETINFSPKFKFQ